MQQDVFLRGHGLDWKAHTAVPELKKMFWGLEALRVIEDKLGTSLYEIRKAKNQMENTIQIVRTKAIELNDSKIWL